MNTRRWFVSLTAFLAATKLSAAPKKDLDAAVINAANAWAAVIVTGTDASRTAAGIALLDAVNIRTSSLKG